MLSNIVKAARPFSQSTLMNISPLDGRYARSVDELRPFFSEYALIRFRVQVELSWYKHLFAEKIVTKDQNMVDRVKNSHEELQKIFDNFNEEDGDRVKTIERTTNHDVKAVEYFLKEKFDATDLASMKEYLHICCTSEDINNLSYAMMMNESLKQVLLPTLNNLCDRLEAAAAQYADIPMLGRTHGQSATPTTVGKEFANYAYRLRRQIRNLERIEIVGKFNGATGNLNAHLTAYPDHDWLRISKEFVEGLGVGWNPYTT